MHLSSLIGQLVSAGVAFTSFSLVARNLSTDDMGNWALFLTIITFGEMIKAGFVQSPLIKYGSGERVQIKQKFEVSSWQINLIMIVAQAFICLILMNFSALDFAFEILTQYTLYGLVVMPFNYSMWKATRDLKIKKAVVERAINAIIFFIGLIALYVLDQLSYTHVVYTFIASGMISSLIALLKKTGFPPFLGKYYRNETIKMVNFAKFHAVSYLGSNLLKSFDTFILAIFLGPVAVAFYNIPLRLVEVIELPLKSFLNVIFPRLSGLHNNSKSHLLKQKIGMYIGLITILYLPFMIGLNLFAEDIILITGGEKYLNSTPIFRVFTIYGLILPLDRICGISLDAIGKPKLNSIKVIFMALSNIIGDFIALYFFDSIFLVAVITVCNAIVGSIIGLVFLRKEIQLEMKTIISSTRNKISKIYLPV